MSITKSASFPVDLETNQKAKSLKDEINLSAEPPTINKIYAHALKLAFQNDKICKSIINHFTS